MDVQIRSCLQTRSGRSAVTARVIALMVAVASVEAFAACGAGHVERGAGHEDRVCVPPAKRQLVMAENARAAMLWGAGSYGARTCALGNVWREAFAGDLICVSAQRREEVRQENLAPQGVP